jgi:phage terminase small subunit
MPTDSSNPERSDSNPRMITWVDQPGDTANEEPVNKLGVGARAASVAAMRCRLWQDAEDTANSKTWRLRTPERLELNWCPMRPLTRKQQRFVDEYLVDLNAIQAAVRAGYSAKTARSICEENLTKPDIRAAIVAAQEARQKRTQIDADWALKRLKDEAEYHGKGSSHAARVAAITTAMKHLGMLNEKHQHTGLDGGPIQQGSSVHRDGAGEPVDSRRDQGGNHTPAS